MGGTLETEQFAWLMELSTTCFLAIREHMDEVTVMVELMLGTKFNCFKENTIASVKRSFVSFCFASFCSCFHAHTHTSCFL
jgi:hypothetical protein